MSTGGAVSAFPNPHCSPREVAEDARGGGRPDASPSLVDLLRGRQAWMDDARCTGRPDVTWFPGPHQSAKPAKAICNRCPVRLECLEFAIDSDERGIWGGLSDAERASLRRHGVRQSRPALTRASVAVDATAAR